MRCSKAEINLIKNFEKEMIYKVLRIQKSNQTESTISLMKLAAKSDKTNFEAIQKKRDLLKKDSKKQRK